MTRTAIVLDSVVFILAVIAFILNLSSFRRSRKLVGRVQAQWSERFNPAYPRERLRWVFLIGVLGMAVALFFLRPASADPYWSLGLVFLILAFYPRNNFVVIGDAGLLDRSVFIPWSSVRERRIVEEKGRRYLEIKVASDQDGMTPVRTRRIRVPGNVSLMLE